MAESPLTLQDLIGTVHDLAPKGSPLEQLAKAAEVSRDLGLLADRLLGHFVEAAREAEHSWTEIGQQLGVTKQGAQQRFVSRSAGGLEGWLEGLTARARLVLELAQDEARLMNHNYLGTEHILLGLVRESEGLGAKALVSLGIPLGSVRERVEKMIGRGSSPAAGPVPATPRARKALRLATREAHLLGHNYVGTEHVLLGLIAEGRGVAAEILRELGGDQEVVKAKVLELLSAYRPPRET